MVRTTHSLKPLYYETRACVAKYESNILMGVHKRSQTFTKLCFEVMCRQWYTLRLCECVYHIKPHLRSRKSENELWDPKNFLNTRFGARLTLCLVDWYLSPGLPRPMNNHGFIGDNEENDEDVWRLEKQRWERNANLFESISLMIYSSIGILKSTESIRRCQSLQSNTHWFFKYTTSSHQPGRIMQIWITGLGWAARNHGYGYRYGYRYWKDADTWIRLRQFLKQPDTWIHFNNF
jgi:hypothetical protein